MKKPIIITSSIIAGAVVLIAALYVLVGMQKNTKTAYASPCVTAQQNLDGPVRKQDLRTRVDRLHSYVFIHQQLDLFVQRLEHNKQPNAAKLREQTTELETALTTFRNNYEDYDIAREQVVKVSNCSSNITEFQQKLQDARNKRQIVNDDVITLDRLLSSTIQPQLSELYAKLLASGTSGVSGE